MQQLLLLHGAIGAKDQLADLEKELAGSYNVHSLNFSGHGGSPLIENFSIAGFTKELIAFLDEQRLATVNIFGYSMGGYVALHAAKHHPQSINKIITLATKFAWDEEIAAREIKMLNAEKISEKLPAFAAALEKRHAPNDWKTVLEKTAAMLLEMGKNNPLKKADYQNIQQPALLMLGDCDKMVSLEETQEVYSSLPNGRLLVLPNTAHPIEVVDKGRLVFEIKTFLQENSADQS